MNKENKKAEKMEALFGSIGKEFYHVLILDKSGSMDVRVNETITGLNEQIQTIKDLEKKNAHQIHNVTLVTFNYDIDYDLYCDSASKLNEFTKADYKPTGGTALNKAIYNTVEKLKTTIEKKGGESSVFVTILTDGENNDYTVSADTVKKVVEEQQKQGWVFSFIGCSQDTIEQAASLGIHKGYTVTMDASNMADTRAKFKSMSVARSYYSSVDLSSSETLNFATLDSLSDEVKNDLLAGNTFTTNVTSTNVTSTIDPTITTDLNSKKD